MGWGAANRHLLSRCCISNFGDLVLSMVLNIEWAAPTTHLNWYDQARDMSHVVRIRFFGLSDESFFSVCMPDPSAKPCII